MVNKQILQLTEGRTLLSARYWTRVRIVPTPPCTVAQIIITDHLYNTTPKDQQRVALDHRGNLQGVLDEFVTIEIPEGMTARLITERCE